MPTSFWQSAAFRTWSIRVLVFVALFLTIDLIGGNYARVISPDMVGFIHDDGVYAISSKALAQGLGYRLLHLPGQPWQIKYPIGYPFLLSLMWHLEPQFPQNLFDLTSFTMLFALLSFILMFYYFKNVKRVPGWLSYLMIWMCACNFYFIYFATSLMSEAPYLFFSLLALFYAETKLKQQPTPARVAVAVLLSAIVFHMRVLGFVLMGAVALWLWLNNHKKQAIFYTIATSLLGAVPWFLWVQLHKPATITAINYPLYKAYSNYSFEMMENYSEKNVLAGLMQTIGSYFLKQLEVMFQLFPNFLKIFPKLDAQVSPVMENNYNFFVAFLSYLLFGNFLLQIIETAKRWWKDRDPSLVSISALYLIFYIAVCIIWKYDAQMSRFLIVLTPWLWYYFFRPFTRVIACNGYRRAWPQLLAIAAFISLCLFPSVHAYNGVRWSREKDWIDMGKYPTLWNEYIASFAFINANLPKDAVLGVEQDVVYYLYTNRLTYYVFYGALRRDGTGYTQESLNKLVPSMMHYGVNYLIVEPLMKDRIIWAPENIIATYALQHYPGQYRLIYVSPRGMIKIYRLFPPEKKS